jgi:DNA-binding NarL/FixJ family response regulator
LPEAMEIPTIRILIAEDHLIARAGLHAVVNAQPDMKVVAEAVDGREVLEMYRSSRPDVTLMDMWMPVLNGFEAAAAIREEFPEARIIALSTFGGDGDIRRAMMVGVQAYLTKDVLHDELIDAIRTVHSGKRYLSAHVVGALSLYPELTAREIEVLRLVAKGLSNKLIASNLGIAEDTAKNHLKNIMKKMGADDRTQAATAAIQRGIVHL